MKYAPNTRRDVVASGTNSANAPPGPPNTGGARTSPMIPAADVGMNQGATFPRLRRAPTILKISVKRKNVRTVAATVLLKVAEMRYATPTTAVRYASAYA